MRRRQHDASALPPELINPFILRLMRYIPLLMKLVTVLPGFIAGFFIACFFFIFIVGRDVFQNEYAPVAGFHIISLLLLRELMTPWVEGQREAAVIRQRVAKQRSFARDVQLQWREKLD